MNVLMIEDDPIVRKSVVQGLSEAGYDCNAAGEALSGMRLWEDKHPDLVILDVMLPGKSGIEVLAEMRGKGHKTPVIMLTALGAVEDRIGGLTEGADDYIVKPFSFLELLARIEAVNRRASTKPKTQLQSGALTLDLSTRRVQFGLRTIELTPTEFTILEMLLRYAGQVVTRQMLCEHIWGFRWEGNTNVIEVHVNRLRQKLDDGEISCIETVRGRGYAIRTSE